MDVRITPVNLSGALAAPPSKSAAHRAVICAALAPGQSRLTGAAPSQDIGATVGAARALGAHIERRRGRLTVTGPLQRGGTAKIDCVESGSTERFFVPIAAALGVEATFLGRGRLPKRPLGPLAEEIANHGAVFSQTDNMPFTLTGILCPGRYTLPGNISSQYVTGLLFALPLLEGDSEIVLTTPLESGGYVDLTLEMLRRFGVEAVPTAGGWRVPGRQRYHPADVEVEGDWSNAAFWLCLRSLGADIEVTGLSPESAQGDRAAPGLFDLIRGGGATLDCSAVPDLVPALTVAALGTRGATTLRGAARLRLKECDRLAALADGFTRLGGQIRQLPDGLSVTGTGRLRGGEASGAGDHRIVMALACAAMLCQSPVVIRGAHAVKKSYPNFFEDYRALGGVLDVL